MRQALVVAAGVDSHGRGGWPKWIDDLAAVELDGGQYDHTLKLMEGAGVRRRFAFDSDHTLLGLMPYLMRVEGRALNKPDLITAIEGLVGVCAIIELDDQLDLLVFCLVEDEQEADRLRDSIRSRVPDDRGVSKWKVGRVTRAPEIATWRALALRFAKRARASASAPGP